MSTALTFEFVFDEIAILHLHVIQNLTNICIYKDYPEISELGHSFQTNIFRFLLCVASGHAPWIFTSKNGVR